MASKYDPYWEVRLGSIRAAVGRAASGVPRVVPLPGLTTIGNRESWYGTVEVRGRDVLRSSMAHATSLGRMVTARGLCAPWPESTFRFTIATAGDTLAVSAAGGRRVQPAAASDVQQGQVPADNAAARDFRGEGPAAGKAPADSHHARGPGDAVVARFHLALGELAKVLHGARHLRDCRGTDGWPRQGVYFFYEPGELRADGGDRVVRVGTHGWMGCRGPRESRRAGDRQIATSTCQARHRLVMIRHRGKCDPLRSIVSGFACRSEM